MVKKHKIQNQSKSGFNVWKIGTFVFAALFLIAILTSGFTNLPDYSTNSDDSDNVVVTGMTVKVLNDARCADCGAIATQVATQLKSIFPDLVVEDIDYSSKEGKELYDSSDLSALPAFLFDDSIIVAENYAQIQSYLMPAGELKSLQIGASFDPNSEICDNGKDDTGDGKVDCEATECQSTWECVQKSDKPVVELFVMSHCPYGTQIEKGMLPAIKTLGDKVDFQLKFVNYAMHGEIEIKEQLNQYCIEEEYSKEKMIEYLECFLTDGDTARCVSELELDSDMITTCVEEVDAEYGIMADFADKSTWKGNFPSFSLHNADNLKYGVGGSPTLIINGAKPSAGRDSASLLNAICFAFNEAPEECDIELSSASPTPGFGWDESASTTTATCD